MCDAENNQEFLEMLEKDYSNMSAKDWETFNIDDYPDVFRIKGKRSKPIPTNCVEFFEIAKEYQSKEEAEMAISKMRQNAIWTKEECDSMVIESNKSDEILDLFVMQTLRKQCLESNKNIFPLNLI